MAEGDSKERRRYSRVNVPIYYRSARMFGPRKPAGDISLGGIRISTDDELKLGKRLEIELFLPDGGTLSCDVRVAWVRPHPEGFAAYEAGLEFLALDEEQAARVARCLDT